MDEPLGKTTFIRRAVQTDIASAQPSLSLRPMLHRVLPAPFGTTAPTCWSSWSASVWPWNKPATHTLCWGLMKPRFPQRRELHTLTAPTRIQVGEKEPSSALHQLPIKSITIYTTLPVTSWDGILMLSHHDCCSLLHATPDHRWTSTWAVSSPSNSWASPKHVSTPTQKISALSMQLCFTISPHHPHCTKGQLELQSIEKSLECEFQANFILEALGPFCSEPITWVLLGDRPASKSTFVLNKSRVTNP